MKIIDVKTFLMHVGEPPRSQWASDGQMQAKSGVVASGFGGARNWRCVKVYTDEGITGIGECSGWPRVIETAVQDLKTILVGQDPTHIERIWQRMHVSLWRTACSALWAPGR